MKFARFVSFAAILGLLAGCYVYDPYYGGYVQPGPPKFDQAWAAAVGAMADQGVQITSEDRTAGVVAGRRGGITVNQRLVQQADGTVRVELNAGGNLSEDPSLPDRVSRSYDARMGRR